MKAREHFYSPYSKFKVGAVLKTKSGKTFTGCNIENASYGLSICAERVVVFKAVSAGERYFDTIAVVADSDDYAFPCGACRQVMREFSKDMTVVVANLRGEKREFNIKDLLPHPFEKL